MPLPYTRSPQPLNCLWRLGLNPWVTEGLWKHIACDKTSFFTAMRFCDTIAFSRSWEIACSFTPTTHQPGTGRSGKEGKGKREDDRIDGQRPPGAQGGAMGDDARPHRQEMEGPGDYCQEEPQLGLSVTQDDGGRWRSPSEGHRGRLLRWGEREVWSSAKMRDYI